jgi:hypothetical protein
MSQTDATQHTIIKVCSLEHDCCTTFLVHAAIDTAEKDLDEHLGIQFADIWCRVDDILMVFSVKGTLTGDAVAYSYVMHVRQAIIQILKEPRCLFRSPYLNELYPNL